MPLATLVFVTQDSQKTATFGALPGFQLREVAATAGYMNTLIDHRCGMIVVDTLHPLWRNFVTAPKSSAATRRIPIVAASDDDGLRAAATMAGADFALSWSELKKDGPGLFADFARIPSAEMLQKLDCQCEEELPALALAGLNEFNRGNYYEQHDLFEALWVETDGPVRDLYRAILQVGVAYYHIKRGNARGALKMLQRSVQWLHILPDVCQGIYVAQLRRDSYAVRAQLEGLGSAGLDDFDLSALKPVCLAPRDHAQFE
jgi:hypothetical protein